MASEQDIPTRKLDLTRQRERVGDLDEKTKLVDERQTTATPSEESGVSEVTEEKLTQSDLTTLEEVRKRGGEVVNEEETAFSPTTGKAEVNMADRDDEMLRKKAAMQMQQVNTVAKYMEDVEEGPRSSLFLAFLATVFFSTAF